MGRIVGPRLPLSTPAASVQIVRSAARRREIALFVDPGGPYPELLTEWYDARDDALSYDGGSPVVAHPPCGPWGRLKHFSKKDDPEHAIWAVTMVRDVGGVLEHPAHSGLWKHCGLPKPGEPADRFGGFTVAVNQSDFGHVARKPTWLYVVRGTVPALPPPRDPTHWVGGFRKSEGRLTKTYRKTGSAVPPGIKVCSAEQRRRTPQGFAEFLIEIASSVRS